MDHEQTPARDGTDPDRYRWQDQHGESVLKAPLHVNGTTFDGRLLGFRFYEDSAVLMDFSGQEAVLARPGADHPDGAFGLLVTAPGAGGDLASAVAQLPDQPALIVIEGGTELTRVLLSQEARLSKGLTSVIVDDGSTEYAVNLIRSGQADAVARTQAWEQDVPHPTESER
ncbi:hypothetical protein D7Z96_20400 [Pseudarthrobacter phenanthrenivorans]|uniref:Uncharacterized protein n=1 Tax=Pseudarthrobacter phenanthrenivorans TaxID=361575 RepID=A0A3B0FM27_PSEPS|nr:hypothetical protein [Pseudarthrobacter phenanthrenivorans]RKO19527.1 hypothetical protein D7Z96_20400 [Pseudarthrobacter phenanthrenivorans]